MNAIIVIFHLVIFLSTQVFAATDLGSELPFKTHSGGKPHIGVSYTYGSDASGADYVFTYLPKVAATEASKKLRWNFYQLSTDSFLLDWSEERVVSLGVLQARLSHENNQTLAIEKIIRGQKADDKGEIFFVLANDKNRPVYNVPISKLCSKYPGNFSDLTHGRSCDDPEL